MGKAFFFKNLRYERMVMEFLKSPTLSIRQDKLECLYCRMAEIATDKYEAIVALDIPQEHKEIAHSILDEELHLIWNEYRAIKDAQNRAAWDKILPVIVEEL